MISLAHAAAITKAKLDTLQPEFRKKAQDWFEACVQAGLAPYIYEGFRSMQRQAELYLKGRGAPGKIVTNAEPGQSFHNYGLAFDWVPLKRVEKAEGMYEADWGNEAAYALGNSIGEKLGMRQLSWERPHLEDARFNNWRELKVSFPSKS